MFVFLPKHYSCAATLHIADRGRRSVLEKEGVIGKPACKMSLYRFDSESQRFGDDLPFKDTY